MSITVNFVQLKRKKSKTGEIPIYIRLTENRRSKYLSTGISLKPEHWNKKKQEVRKNHPLYQKYNSELLDIKLKTESKKSDLRKEGELDSDTLKDEINSSNSDTLRSFGDDYLTRLKTHDRYWEFKHVKVVLADIERLGLINTPISRIDQKFLNKLQDYLVYDKGNKPNTVRNKLQRFRGLVTSAFKKGLLSKDPFYNFERVKKEKVSRAKLGEKEIARIISLELEKDSDLWHTRNYFMFSFYLAGIRFSDLCTLTPANLIDGRLKYEMKKTGGKKNIKLLEPALEILEHYNTTNNGEYIFPILKKVYKEEFTVRRKISSRNVIINRNLKEIAKKAKVQETISFHVSRHSFANFALQKGMNVYSISKALAHSDLKTTEIYLKSFDEEMLDDEMENIFN